MSFVPAATVAAGVQGTFFPTAVEINNAGATSLTYRLLWLPRGADNSNPVQSQQFSLAAGAGVPYANVLDSVFGLDSDQEALETKAMSLPPYSNNQITRVFRNHAPVSAGYVDVWTTTPGASIYCYGSVLDNETSDPTTVLPQ